MAKKLWIEDIASFPACAFQETSPTGDWIDESSDIDKWKSVFKRIIGDYWEIRNTLITNFISGWDSLTETQKRFLIENYIYPDGQQSYVDSLYSEEDQYQIFIRVMKKMDGGCKHIIKKSSDSLIPYYVKLDDTGVLISNLFLTYQTI